MKSKNANLYVNTVTKNRILDVIIWKLKHLKPCDSKQQNPSVKVKMSFFIQSARCVECCKYNWIQISIKENKKFKIHILVSPFDIRQVQKHPGIRAYKVIVRPILLYGSETWTLKRSHEKRIESAEMKFQEKEVGIDLQTQ